HSPVWIPCQPASFREHCFDSSAACFQCTIAGTAFRFLRGEVAMSSLRQLDADQPQTHCPRSLLLMRATRHFLKQLITIGSTSCLLARPQSCVSDHKFIL